MSHDPLDNHKSIDLGAALSSGAVETVTWCNCVERFTVGFSSSCWGLGWPSIGVSARAPEVPQWPPRSRPLHSSPSRRCSPIPERLALAGFLAGYSGLTRQAYELDLRQFASWWNLCRRRHNWQYAVEEELLDRSPGAHVRRPRLDYESHATGLDRNEVGALLVAAGLGPPAEHALVSLLALNGLRVSEATGADIETLGVERGHRTLVITRKGGKVVTIPLAPRTARAIDLAIGERAEGPIFLAADGRRLDRHGAGRIVRRIARRAGIVKRVGPHTLRHAFITAALDAGVPLRDVQEAALHADPRTTMRYDNSRELHQMGELNTSFRELAA
jgi:integrase/recombinase XerD